MKSFALITGASSGIGLQICHSLASRGYNVILTSRSEDKLKSISEQIRSKYKVESNFFPMDLADKNGPQNIFNFCRSNNYHIDILINNAGYALPESFEKNSVEDEEKCIRVLGTSVISLTKLFVREMIKKKQGKIMIVSSVAAFAPPAAILLHFVQKPLVRAADPNQTPRAKNFSCQKAEGTADRGNCNIIHLL